MWFDFMCQTYVIWIFWTVPWKIDSKCRLRQRHWKCKYLDLTYSYLLVCILLGKYTAETVQIWNAFFLVVLALTDDTSIKTAFATWNFWFSTIKVKSVTSGSYMYLKYSFTSSLIFKQLCAGNMWCMYMAVSKCNERGTTDETWHIDGVF